MTVIDLKLLDPRMAEFLPQYATPGSARLDLISTPLHGFSATLTLPQSRSSADDHHLNPADD